MADLLSSLLGKRESLTKRGVVSAIGDQTVSVQLDGGVRQIPKGIVAVKAGDQVTVQGGQILGRRRPTKPKQTYRV